MKQLLLKAKPKKGFSHFFHVGLNVVLPIVMYVLVSIDLELVALAVILLSKWRIFAVRARHWPANLRANSVDIIIGVSALVFMADTTTQLLRIVWAIIYAAWLTIVKPLSNKFGVGIQAFLAHVVGFSALMTAYNEVSIVWLVLAAWAISYSSMRHFLSSYDESATRFFAYFWAYVNAVLMWLLAHWLIYYGQIAQITLVSSLIALALGTLYYLHHDDRLSEFIQRQVVVLGLAALAIVIVFSDWASKVIE